MRSLRTTRKSNPHSPQLEKAHVQQRRPNAAKNRERKMKENSKTNPTPEYIYKTVTFGLLKHGNYANIVLSDTN